MAVMYGGEPLQSEETPVFQPSALGPSLHTLGNIRYRIGHNSITIYAFEDDSSSDDDDDASGDQDKEPTLEDDSDCDSFGYPVVRRSRLRPNPGNDQETPEMSQEGTKDDQAQAGPSTEKADGVALGEAVRWSCGVPGRASGVVEGGGAAAGDASSAVPVASTSSSSFAGVASAAGSAAGSAASDPSSSAAAALGASGAAAATAGPSAGAHVPPPPPPPASPPPNPEPPLAYWTKRTHGAVPRGAVLVGPDLDGGALFVGRACVYGELLAGKVATHHRVCYVASEGRELAFEKYEVLVLKRGRVVWVPGKNGSFPFDAFPAGLTLQNQRVYVARARVKDVVTPGRLVVGEKECRISYDMKEYKFPEYEILTVRFLDPNENGMVRSVSAENLYVSGRKQRRYKHFGWCGTDMASNEEDIDEEIDEYDEEEEEEEVEEEEVGDDDVPMFEEDEVIFLGD